MGHRMQKKTGGNHNRRKVDLLSKRRMRIGGMLLGLAAALVMVVAACGSEEEKPTLIFSDLSWDSAQIQNAIVRQIAEYGYGYTTEAVYGDTIPLFEAINRGDTNITMEIWLPNQAEAWAAALAEGNIQNLGKSLADNWQSNFIIPQYTKDANPGLVSVEDLKKPEYMELFVTPDSNGKARALGCISGWSCADVNEQKIEAYGLSDSVQTQDPGSNAALDAEIIGSYEKGDDILFYYWGPTSLSNRLETEFDGFYVLEEPAYSEACWGASKGCAYATSEILIAMRSDIAEQAPDIVALLEKWEFSAASFIQAANYLGETEAEYADVAAWWLQNNDVWKAWVEDDVAEKVLEGIQDA